MRFQYSFLAHISIINIHFWHTFQYSFLAHISIINIHFWHTSGENAQLFPIFLTVSPDKPLLHNLAHWSYFVKTRSTEFPFSSEPLLMSISCYYLLLFTTQPTIFKPYLSSVLQCLFVPVRLRAFMSLFGHFSCRVCQFIMHPFWVFHSWGTKLW